MLQNIKSVAAKGLFTGFVMTAVLACGQDEFKGSELRVTNGVEISEEEFPSTVLLVMQQGMGTGICTATFVNDRQALTASHCLHGLDPHNPMIYYVTTGSNRLGGQLRGQALAESFVTQPNYSLDYESGVNRYDLAIVNFPANTAPASSPVARTTPKIGSDITIVGYGNNQNFILNSGHQGGQGSGVKRAGRNELQHIDNDMLVFAGLPGQEAGFEVGQMASSGSGDSGGPMFVDGQLVGVTSGGGLAQLPTGQIISVSRYVDLNSDVSRRFLAAHLDSY